MCRTLSYFDPQGYFFEVVPTGDFLITRYAKNEFTIIPEGTNAEAIQQTNHLTAVCVGDYLAFYANGQLLTETVDSTFQSGFPGWLASQFATDESVIVDFDNFTVWSASAGKSNMTPPATQFDAGQQPITLQRHILQESFDRVGIYTIRRITAPAPTP